MPHPFPSIHSVLSPEAIVSEILPGFRIGTVSHCQFFSGGFNDTYQVKTTDHLTYYLRVYRIQWRTLADIRYELDVLNHLKAQGFPAAQPVPYQEEEFYCAVQATEGTRYLALFTEAPGEEISYKQDAVLLSERYGQAVARMHNALDSFSSPYPRFHLDLEHFIDHSLRNAKPFMVNQTERWAYLTNFAESLRQHILDLPEAELEQGFCHGDLQGYHANISPNGKFTFYDFDCGGFGYRAYDLAVFLWCCRLEDAVQTRWEPFLNGYLSMRTLSELDLAAVPLFVCARYLWHMGVHTRNSPDWGIGFLNDQYFENHFKRLEEASRDYLKAE